MRTPGPSFGYAYGLVSILFVVGMGCSQMGGRTDGGSSDVTTEEDSLLDGEDEEQDDACESPVDGCPLGPCHGHCVAGDVEARVGGSGRIIETVLQDGLMGTVNTGTNSAWGTYSWTDIWVLSIGSVGPIKTDVADQEATAAVWTGSQFGIFLEGTSTGGPRLLMVDPEDGIVSDVSMSREYEMVTWVDDRFVALWYIPYNGWHLVWIGTGGAENSLLLEELSQSQPVGHLWIGTHFLIGYTVDPGEADFRYHLAVRPYAGDGLAAGPEHVLDESGMVTKAIILGADEGAVVVWLESETYSTQYTLMARFIDGRGAPCSPVIVVVEFEMPDSGYFPHMRHPSISAGWTGDRVIISYERKTGEIAEVVVRSLLVDGSVGPANVVENSLIESTHTLAVERDRMAIGQCRFSAMDAPPGCYLDLRTCSFE